MYFTKGTHYNIIAKINDFLFSYIFFYSFYKSNFCIHKTSKVKYRDDLMGTI